MKTCLANWPTDFKRHRLRLYEPCDGTIDCHIPREMYMINLHNTRTILLPRETAIISEPTTYDVLST